MAKATEPENSSTKLYLPWYGDKKEGRLMRGYSGGGRGVGRFYTCNPIINSIVNHG